jgi:hypothetical protein
MEIEDPADDPEVLLDKSERRDAIRGCLSQLSAARLSDKVRRKHMEWRVIGADNE